MRTREQIRWLLELGQDQINNTNAGATFRHPHERHSKKGKVLQLREYLRHSAITPTVTGRIVVENFICDDEIADLGEFAEIPIVARRNVAAADLIAAHHLVTGA